VLSSLLIFTITSFDPVSDSLPFSMSLNMPAEFAFDKIKELDKWQLLFPQDKMSPELQINQVPAALAPSLQQHCCMRHSAVTLCCLLYARQLTHLSFPPFPPGFNNRSPSRDLREHVCR
jgi:hypothetical protein